MAPLCGEPVLPALFGDPLRLSVASALWYFMFYSPRDMFNNVLRHAAVKVPLGLVKGVYYPRKLVAGLKHSKHLFKANPLCAVAVATLKGNGSGIIKPFARLVRGKWTPEAFETLKPSVTTKLCVILAAIYFYFPLDAVYIFAVGIFVAMKVSFEFCEISIGVKNMCVALR